MGMLFCLFVLWQSSRPIVDVAPITSALSEQRFAAALQLTERLLLGNARDPRIWTLQGFAHTGLKNQPKALEDFRQAVKVSPAYLPALKAEAQLEYEIHDENCVRTLKRLTAIEPNDPVSHGMLAALAYERHDCPAVVANYLIAETLIASQDAALTQYGECLVETGQKEKAIKILANAVALKPASWQFRYNLAVAHLLANMPTDALAALQPVLESQEPHVVDIASSAYEQTGDTPHAVETLREAIITHPTESFLYLHFADLCFAHDSFQVGIDMLNAGLKRLPDSAPLYLTRGVLYVQLSAYEKAESDFDKAARLDPSQSFSSVAEGLTQLQKNNLDGALAMTRAQLKVTPKDGYLYYIQAETLRQKGAEPGTAEFEQAVSAAEMAVQLRKNFALALDLLGTLYLRQGKLPLAIGEFESILQFEPTNESALYHLIVASRRSGNTETVPDLMRRLAGAKVLNKERDERMNRYAFVEPDQ